MEELNKKLAEWAGFKRLPMGNKGFHFERAEKVMNWMPPGGDSWWDSMPFLPNFADSLNACFEWLVPKAIEQIKTKSNFVLSDFSAYVLLFGRWLDEGFDALALCKAIEKLIDGAGKDV